MKVLIIGGVAGGASAAARLRRLDEAAQIILFERGAHISFANCGLPYYIGGTIKAKSSLLLQTPAEFKKRFEVDVRILSEVIGVNTKEKMITVYDHHQDQTYQEPYDKLIVAPGAKPLIPPIPGISAEGVFTIRDLSDAVAVTNYLERHRPTKAVVVGGGFIGIEMAENLANQGLKVSIVEQQEHLLGSFDYEAACIVHQQLRQQGVELWLNHQVKQIVHQGNSFEIELSGQQIQAGLVILAVGVRPDTAFLTDSGIARNQQGGILVNSAMQTSVPDVYAVGDAVEVTDFVSQQQRLIPLAGPANKQGRIAADQICNIDSHYHGTQGSAIVKVFDLTAAASGMSEKVAREQQLDYEKTFLFPKDHAGYYPDSNPLFMKVIFEKVTGKILGAQLVGRAGVDKRCDLLAAAIRAGMSATDLADLELCYAPPYGSAKDPVNFAGYVIENIVSQRVSIYHWHEVADLPVDGSITMLDVRTAAEFQLGHIAGAVNLPLDQLRAELPQLDRHKPIYVNCQSGLRSYIACRVLMAHGFSCYNLAGGFQLYDQIMKEQSLLLPEFDQEMVAASETTPQLPSSEQIQSVKGKGFLYNKGTDAFSGRVITENGVLNAQQMAVVTNAANQFGNGQIALTVRMTLEIQGIPFAKIADFTQYIEDHGLKIGGTGARVRPIVACKGTTCSNGLCDTFAIATQVHQRFYEGYREVTLPHKFKIAVGGCPNNCVKPDLNDIGLVAVRPLIFDADGCRGCKKCGIIKACKSHAVSLAERKLVVDRSLCNACGGCAGKCYFTAVSHKETEFKIYIGGKWGKRSRPGSLLSRNFTESEALDMIEKVILLFKQLGQKKERFGDMIDRIGLDEIEARLASQDLLIAKTEILQMG